MLRKSKKDKQGKGKELKNGKYMHDYDIKKGTKLNLMNSRVWSDKENKLVRNSEGSDSD